MPKKQVNPKLLLFALTFLAAMSFIVGYFMLTERFELLETGEKTGGVVIRIKTGVKGLKSTVVAFETADARQAVGVDIHNSQWFAANEIGERVSLYYRPNNPEKILIDRGLMIWSNPLFMWIATLILIAIGPALLKQQTKKSG